MVVNKRKTNRNNNTFSSLDKTQKGGGIWLCAPGEVKYDNINEALSAISNAKKDKLINLIFKARDRDSIGFFASKSPGYTCLIKYLEAYYKLTTDTTIQPNKRTVKPNNLIDFKVKKRYRILLALIYLYLMKSISLDTTKLESFYSKMTEARKAISDDTATTTPTGAPSITPVAVDKKAKKAKKVKYYENVISAANTLINTQLKDESTLIIEYDDKLKRIKVEQAELEASGYEKMSVTSNTIFAAKKRQADAERKLVESSVVNMSAEQIIEMRSKINNGLQKLIEDMKKYNRPDKAVYEARINDYSNTYKRILPANDNDPASKNKVALKTLEQNVLSLVAIIEKTLNPTKIDVIKKGVIWNTKGQVYSSLYGVTLADMLNEPIDKLIPLLNSIGPNTISIDEDLNPNIITLLNRINALKQQGTTNADVVKQLELYMNITIDIRYAILSAIIKNDKINQYEDIVINILQSMNEQELATVQRNPATKLDTILKNINISLLNSNCRALILKTVTPDIIVGLDNNKIVQLFTFTLPFVDGDIFPSITAYKFIAILNALKFEKINFIPNNVLQVIMNTIGTESIKIIDKVKLVNIITKFRVPLTPAEETALIEATTLTPAALAALTPASARELTAAALAALTPAHVAALTPAARAALPPRTIDDVMRAATAAAAAGGPGNAGPIAFINTLSNAANLPLIINATPIEITEIAKKLYNIGLNDEQKAYIKYAAIQAGVRHGEAAAPHIHVAFNANVLPQNTRTPGAYNNNGNPTEDDAMYGAVASGNNAGAPAAAALLGYTALMNAVYNVNGYNQAFNINAQLYTNTLVFPEWDRIIKPFITQVSNTNQVTADAIITDIANGNPAVFQLGGAKRSRHSKSKRNHKSKKHNTNNKKVSRKHRNVKSKYNSKSKKNNKNTKRRKSKHH